MVQDVHIGNSGSSNSETMNQEGVSQTSTNQEGVNQQAVSQENVNHGIQHSGSGDQQAPLRETLVQRALRRQAEDAAFEEELQRSRGTIADKNLRRNERRQVRDREDMEFFAAREASTAPEETASSTAQVGENNNSTDLDFSNLSSTRFSVQMPRLKPQTLCI